MTTLRRVIYSEAAHERRRQLIDDFARRIETELTERKYVPGADVIEATASDLEELSRAMHLQFRNRFDQRGILREFVVRLYLIIGAATFAAGLFFREVRSLLTDPTRALLIGTGLAMIVAGWFLQYSLQRQNATLWRRGKLSHLSDDDEQTNSRDA